MYSNILTSMLTSEYTIRA